MTETNVTENKSKKQDKKRIPIEKGMEFGRLTVIKEVEPYIDPSGKESRKIKLQCDCGNTTEVVLKHLNNGHTRSCGCLRKEELSYRFTTHGQSQHPLYGAWKNMNSRCSNLNDVAYKYYGGRGITVCNEWSKDMVAFLSWALENGWKSGLILDKIDNDKGYSPANCRFIGNSLSRRNTRLLSSTNTSGYRGVSFCKQRNKWESKIGLDGKTYHLGRFATAKEAAYAYDAKVREFGIYFPLNFPSEGDIA